MRSERGSAGRSASVVIHSATKIDAAGSAPQSWIAFDRDRIVATGGGTGWRDFATGAELVDAQGLTLAPGFVDIHAHGGGGFGFDDGQAAIAAALDAHRVRGTTRSVISLVANPVDELVSELEAVARLTAADPLVLGSHLEGPFLATARRGAHNAAYLLSPTPQVIERLLAAAGGTLRQLTLAPELSNALAAVSRLAAAGLRVAVGHTEATAEQTRAAFDAGATLLTHAFNAMPPISARAPGPVVAALADPRVTLELILDRLHVDDDLVRLSFDLAPDRIALVSDAMAAAGAGPGSYRLGPSEVVVADGVARIREPDGSLGPIAGSTLTLDAALRNAVSGLGIDPVRAVAAVTSVPARALGVGDHFGMLAPGYAADAVLLDQDWQVRAVWAAGRRLR